MKRVYLSLFFLLLCGCFKAAPQFSSLKDYSLNFEHKQKISLMDKKTLTLDEARTIALANNPTLRAAASAIRQAQYGYYRALSAWSPEITAHGEAANTLSRGYDLHNPPPGVFPEENRFSSVGTIRASWLLFDGLARELDILISKLEYEQSSAIADDVKRLLLRAVVYTWCDIFLATEEIIIARADMDFQNAALTQAQQQFKSGHISYSTVLNFKILSAKAQSNIAISQYNKQTALNALAALLGSSSSEIPADIKLEPLSDTGKSKFEQPLQYYLEQAILNRPDMKAEKLQFEKAIRQKQSVYAEFMPKIHLFTEFSFGSGIASYEHYKVNGSHYNHPSFTYGASASWNIFRGFASWNELRRKEALEQIALWGLNKKYLDVTIEVSDALDNCRNTLIQIVIFKEMANWVQEQRNLIYSEYINGRETIARVNQAQSALVEAQSSLALWQIRFHKAQAQLKAALGTD